MRACACVHEFVFVSRAWVGAVKVAEPALAVLQHAAERRRRCPQDPTGTHTPGTRYKSLTVFPAHPQRPPPPAYTQPPYTKVMFNRTLPIARARTRAYFGCVGAYACVWADACVLADGPAYRCLQPSFGPLPLRRPRAPHTHTFNPHTPLQFRRRLVARVHSRVLRHHTPV